MFQINRIYHFRKEKTSGQVSYCSGLWDCYRGQYCLLLLFSSVPSSGPASHSKVKLEMSRTLLRILENYTWFPNVLSTQMWLVLNFHCNCKWEILWYFSRIWMFPAVTAKQQRKAIQVIQSRMKLPQQWLAWCQYCWLPTHSTVPGSLLKHIRHRQLSCQPSNMTALVSSLMISVRLTTGSVKTLPRYN